MIGPTPRAHARRARTRHALATVLAVAGVVPAVLGVGADGGQESALVSDKGETAAGEPAWTVAAGSARWAGDVQAVAPADDTATGVALPAVSGVITENAARVRLAGGVTVRIDSDHDAEDVSDVTAGSGTEVREVRLTRLEVFLDGDEGVLVADVASHEVAGVAAAHREAAGVGGGSREAAGAGAWSREIAGAEVASTEVAGDTAASFASGTREYTTVVLGALDLTDHPLTVADGRARVSDVPITLTAAGAAALADEPLPDRPTDTATPDGLGSALVTETSGAATGPAAAEVPRNGPLLSVDLELGPPPRAPVVTGKPRDAAVGVGEDAVFTTAVTGLPVPDIRWQIRAAGDANWRDIPDGSSTRLVLPAVRADQHGAQVRAVVSNGIGPDVFTEPATLTVASPSVAVFAADGVTPVEEVAYGDTVVVRGTGFSATWTGDGEATGTGDSELDDQGDSEPDDQGDQRLDDQGDQTTVVAFGKLADEWRPSVGAPRSARIAGAERRVATAGGAVPSGEMHQPDQIGADGSFTVALEVAAPGEGWPQEGTFAVYTYAAGDVPDPAREVAVPVRLVARPALDVRAADGVTAAADATLDPGDTVVVRGTGFDPTLADGTVVAFGRFAETWQPSAGAPTSARAVGAQVVVAPGTHDAGAGATPEGAVHGAGAELGSSSFGTLDRSVHQPAVGLDGSFTVTLTVTEPAEAPADGIAGIYTYAAGEQPDPFRELAVALTVRTVPDLPGLPPVLDAAPILPSPTDGTPEGEPADEPLPADAEERRDAAPPAREGATTKPDVTDAAPVAAASGEETARPVGETTSALVVLVVLALVAGAFVRGLRGD